MVVAQIFIIQHCTSIYSYHNPVHYRLIVQNKISTTARLYLTHSIYRYITRLIQQARVTFIPRKFPSVYLMPEAMSHSCIAQIPRSHQGQLLLQ